MRITDWRISLAFLILCGAVVCSFGVTNKTTPLYSHDDPKINREFQNAYQTMARSPAILVGAGAPNFAPQKQGDIYLSTSTAKIYIATGTATSGSWTVVN